MRTIKDEFIQARKVLDSFLANDDHFISIEKAGKLMAECIQRGNKIIACGNGGSMCDAMHFAEELSGRYRKERRSLAAIAISDPSYITCTANDYGFDAVFSRFIEGLACPGDLLLAISTSGNSANIVNALVAARNKGMKTVCLTGKDGGRAAINCDIEIRAPFSEFSDRTQEIHIKIIHALICYIEQQCC